MKGPNLAGMAWRNLWRSARRTIITASTIAFGIMIAVIFTGVGDDSWTKTIDVAARLGGGHVTIQHPAQLETPSAKNAIGGVKAKQAVAMQDPAVVRTVTRITGHAMLATARKSYGAWVIAIDPAAEDESTFGLLEAVKKGAMFGSADAHGIVLGWRLAENLGASIGRKVVVTMTDRSGEIVSDLVRVTGIVRSGAPGVDGALCILPLNTVRKILGYGPDESQMVAVFVRDHRKSDEVAAALNARLGDRATALPWSTTQPDLRGFISMKVGGTIFFELIILILAAAGIFNTLFVSVMERMREFGIMMAIGFSPGRLFRLVMWESLWLGVVGLIAAVAVTAWPYWYLHTHGIDLSFMTGGSGAEIAGVGIDLVMYVTIFPESAFNIVAAVVGATLISGLYPAWKAGRVVPVESIKLV